MAGNADGHCLWGVLYAIFEVLIKGTAGTLKRC